MERWADVRGFEGVYQISTLGRLKSFKVVPDGHVLSNKNEKGGYLSVILRSKNCTRSTRIHRLVLETFVSNPDNRPQVNHKDGNKQNNCLENLEWVNQSENMKDAVRRNPNVVQAMNYYNQFVRPKTILQFSLSGQLLGEFSNSKIAGVCTGVCARNILQVAGREEYKQGKTRKQAGGFVWEFKQENGGEYKG